MDDINELTRDELIKRICELEQIVGGGKYGIFFDRKSFPEEIVNHCIKNIPIIVHQKNNDVICGGSDNILVEGDNYACLYALNNLGTDGLVDIICIDPPYNTGNGDFTFNDGFKHTDWLCMIERRLVLAKNILKDTGIIYIDIDDNECADLKMLCDSIFGSENFLNDFIWLNNMKGRQISTGGAVKTYEHILLYAKNADRIPTFEGDIRELSKEMPLVYKDAGYNIMTDNKGKFIVKNELYNTNSAFNEETRPNLVFDIYYNPITGEVKTSDVDNDPDLGSNFKHIEPHKNSDGVHRYHAWRWSKEKIANESDELYFTEINDEWKVYTKLRDIYSTNIKDVISNSTNGNSEIKKILGKNKFSYPKPVQLIKRLIKNYEKIIDTDGETVVSIPEPIVVLDFFAGSGTTGQAVLELNKEDGINRTFILNTLNEVSDTTAKNYLIQKGIIPTKIKKSEFEAYKATPEYAQFTKSSEYQSLGVCYSVALARLKTVLTGIRPDGSKYSDGLSGNLRYFKVDFVEDSPYKEQTKYNLADQCDGLLCILESCFDKYSGGRDYNIYLNSKKDKSLSIFNNNYEEKEFDEMLSIVLSSSCKENVVYYFSLDSNIDPNIEKIVKTKLPEADVKPIPSKIYEIYKKIEDDVRRKY